MKAKRRKPKTDRKAARVAAIKARLLDIAAGLHGASLGDYTTAIECNCIIDTSRYGHWLSAVWNAFGVPDGDLMRMPTFFDKLSEFDDAAAFIEERMSVWEAKS